MKLKIESLTPEQKAKMPEYVKKWVDIGTNTDRLDPVRAQKTIDNFRKLIGRVIDVPLLIVDNPLEAWVTCYLFNDRNVPVDDLKAEMTAYFNGNPEKYDIGTPSLPWQTGSFYASTFSFYDFMVEEVGVELEAELYAKYKVWEATSQIGCIYPLDGLTVVSQKPITIHLNENNMLHKDGGPAIEYAGMGNLKVYSLNGVHVPEYVAVTPEEQLDLEYYNTIENADVKAEFVRKAGVERFLDKAKLMDTYKNYDKETYPWVYRSQYQLYDMSFLFGGLSYAPFLYMKNITTEIFHLEGVSPNCKTLKEAIKERTGFDMANIQAIA